MLSTMSNEAPAGWYPNPDASRVGTVRWWDGTAWTDLEHTDFSGIDASRLSKNDARAHIADLQASVRELEDIINRHGLRQYEKFNQWRQEQLNGLNNYRSEASTEVNRLESQKAALRQEIESLRREIVILKDTKEFQDIGYFDFDHPAESSTALAGELEQVRLQIKQALRNKTATSAAANLTFEGSSTKGRKLINDLTKLMLRAYNAEAENAIKTTRAGNLVSAQTRLVRAAQQIATNGALINLNITQHYHDLRIKEIELAHRHLSALKREKELERERRAALREQRKAEEELKREQERLEKEKTHYETTLKTLRANGDDQGVARMLEKLRDVEQAIQDVDYRAANIRAGYVYVISNVGSFGPNVVKIGMTRRLDPMDRVRELGDASVPFRFDVHALFFADDAVAVEAMLHREFAQQRINQINLRREYFDITPQAVLEKLREQQVEVLEFTIEPEAEEFLESQHIRDRHLSR